MEKSSNSSRDKEGISYELPNFDLQFLDKPPANSKRFANLSGPELSRLVEKRHSDKTKKSTKWSLSTFRGKYCIVRVLDRIF